MKSSVFAVIIVFLVTGCSATWQGVKEDTSNTLDWSKKKVNTGATSVKESTE